MKKGERAFYEELDRAKSKKKEKTLPVWELIVFFVILIAVCEGVLFGLGKAIRNRPDDSFSVSGTSSGGINLVSTNKNGGASEVTIPQGALCSELVKALKNDISCAIQPGEIVISGKISPLLPSNASVSFSAKAQSGEIKFETTSLKIGSIGMPKFIAYPISSALGTAVNSNLPSNVTISKIDLKEAVMVISTELK